MVRLIDVAARANVSVMTVSKVLRNASDISAKTKARVRKIAEEMGYVPDSLAQGLRNRTTKLFGLIISSATNPLAAQNIAGVQERAAECGYDLILAQTANEVAREESSIRRMVSRRVDGLIVTPVHRFDAKAAVYEELRISKTPVVILGARARFCAGFANVETEDRKGALEATRHLLSLGHRNVGFLAGPAVAPWAQERFAGYQKGLREAGLEVRDHLVFTAGFTIEDGQKAMLEMLNENVRPTAILAVNDQVAMGAAKILLRQGIKIPGDVSLIGFGNGTMAENFLVPLTTVSQPQYRLGVSAVELLQDLLKGEPPSSRTLPTELIARASTGKAREPR